MSSQLSYRFIRLLQEAQGGSTSALEDLSVMIRTALSERAHHHRRTPHREGFNAPTLLGEAWVRLSGGAEDAWQERAFFLATASHILRRQLVAEARERAGAPDRNWNGDAFDALLRNAFSTPEERCDTLLQLDVVLAELESIEPQQSRIVECRYFGGMTIEETAAALHLSPSAVKTGWNGAQAFLHRRLQRDVEV